MRNRAREKRERERAIEGDKQDEEERRRRRRRSRKEEKEEEEEETNKKRKKKKKKKKKKKPLRRTPAWLQLVEAWHLCRFCVYH